MKRALAALAALLLMLIVCAGTGYAAEMEYPFAVEIIVPENSIDQLGYYHVPSYPGESIALQAKLSNLTDQPVEISAVPLDAYSGLDGISYLSPDEADPQTYALIDESYGLAQHIETMAAVRIAPNSSRTVDILVSVPDDIGAGTLLGGIGFVVFTGTQQVRNEEVNSSTILIDEYLSIVTGIQIDIPGTVQPSVSAGTPKLTDKGICIPIRNEAALIQEGVSGAYQIKDAKGTVLVEGNAASPKMAPMTELRIFEPWDGSWDAGDYTLYMQLDVNGETEDYVQPFTIGEETVSQVEHNQQDEQAARESAGAPDAAPAGSSEAVQQKAIINALVFGIPTVFVCVFLWLVIKKRSRIRRERVRQMTGKRYVSNY